MKFSRILALLLALAMILSLAACGDQSAASGSAAASSADTAAPATSEAEPAADDVETPDITLPAEAEADVVAYLTDGAYHNDDVVATVGQTDITAAQLFYWIAYQAYELTYRYYYSYGYLLTFEEDMGNGTTAGEYIANLGATTAIAYAAAAEKARELNVTVSAEDAEALANFDADNIESYCQTRWDSFVSAGLIDEADYDDAAKAAWIQTEGEQFYEHSMLYFSTTKEAYEQLTWDFCYYSALQESLFGEGGEYAPTEETLADYLQSYISDNGVIWGRCILFSTADCETDEDRAAVLAEAQQTYDQLSVLSGDALEQAFTEQQTAFDKSGYTPGEVQHYTNTDSLVDGYYSGLEALEPGQVGITDLTDYGYFVLLREADNTDDIADTVEQDYIATTYDALVTEWQSDYGVDTDSLLPDLDAISYFTALQALQSTLTTVDTVG
ncbi:MAG: hypothetical protein IJ751_08780 [Oscillospiraceae bacterium]|nr:hypothetical protein [Oscillospiraceae bacterium]